MRVSRSTIEQSRLKLQVNGSYEEGFDLQGQNHGWALLLIGDGVW